MSTDFFADGTVPTDDYSNCQNNVPKPGEGVPLFFLNGHINPILNLCPPDW